jgi:antitoxin MazE
MQLPVIKIGNSKGIRLSKSLLERYNIRDRIELILEKGRIILKPVPEPRQGWDEAFHQMHSNGEDDLLIPDVFDDETTEEWN